MKNGLLEKIKSRGYWRINFQPLTASSQIETLRKCRELVEKSSIELRGWDFPHIPRNNDDYGGVTNFNDYVEAWVDWNYFKEFWRIYKSAQFLCYRGLREDWYEEGDFGTGLSKRIQPGKVVSVLGSLIYEVTEAFEFLSRLSQKGVYQEGVTVDISLHGTEDRILLLDDPRRAPFISVRRTGAPELVYNRTYSKGEVDSSSKQLATDLILQFLDAFGWNPPSDLIERDQTALLSGRL
jgi:hypothetical protein